MNRVGFSNNWNNKLGLDGYRIKFEMINEILKNFLLPVFELEFEAISYFKENLAVLYLKPNR